MKGTREIRAKRRLLALVACAAATTAWTLVADIARAEGGWACGAWAADPTGRCEEARSCTRRVCADIDKPDTCIGETRTECVNPNPAGQPTPGGSSVPSPGGPPPTPEPPPGGSMGTPGPVPETPAPLPATTPLTVECIVKGSRIYAVNSTSDRIVPRGTTIWWQTFPLGLAGRKRLAEDILPGQAAQIAKVPFALQCTASIVQS